MPPFSSKEASPSALDAAWEQTGQNKKPEKRRQLTRKSSEAEVQKAIYDSLKGMRPEEIDGNRDENGMTARDVVTQRKKLHREDPETYPCGARFYNEVRAKFQTKDRPIDRLVSNESDGPISAQVLQAMVAYKKNGNRAPLAGCLTVLEDVSRAELVGILRWALELRPTNSAEQLKYSMDVGRFITRLQLHKKFPKDIGVMADWLDNMLTHVFSKAKCDQTKPSVFIQIHADIVFLVLPKEATEKIVQHVGPFTEIESELAEASASRLGMALFGTALHSVLGETRTRTLSCRTRSTRL